METGFMDLVRSCGPAYIVLFSCFLIASLAAIIANTSNLSMARQYMLSGDSSQDGFKRFMFWPKVLKGLGVLLFLVTLLGTAVAFEAVFQFIMSRPEPSARDMYRGAYESLATLCFGTALTFCIFTAYYIFRILLYRIRYYK